MLDEEIRALELSLLAASGQPSTPEIAKLVADDFREFGASGRIYGKDEVLAALRSAPPRPADAPEPFLDFHVTELAPGAALATFRTPRSLRCSIWRHDGDRWRIHFHQGTPVPAPGA